MIGGDRRDVLDIAKAQSSRSAPELPSRKASAAGDAVSTVAHATFSSRPG